LDFGVAALQSGFSFGKISFGQGSGKYSGSWREEISKNFPQNFEKWLFQNTHRIFKRFTNWSLAPRRNVVSGAKYKSVLGWLVIRVNGGCLDIKRRRRTWRSDDTPRGGA